MCFCVFSFFFYTNISPPLKKVHNDVRCFIGWGQRLSPFRTRQKKTLKRKYLTDISFQTFYSPQVFLCMQQNIKPLGQMSPDFISSVWVINLWS